MNNDRLFVFGNPAGDSLPPFDANVGDLIRFGTGGNAEHQLFGLFLHEHEGAGHRAGHLVGVVHDQVQYLGQIQRRIDQHPDVHHIAQGVGFQGAEMLDHVVLGLQGRIELTLRDKAHFLDQLSEKGDWPGRSDHTGFGHQAGPLQCFGQQNLFNQPLLPLEGLFQLFLGQKTQVG